MECVLDWNCLLLKELLWKNVKYSSLRIWNVFQFAVFIFYWKLLWGECKMLFYRDVEYISGCHYVLLKAPLVRVPNTCYYTLLKTLLGRESDTVPQGYGMYFRLKLSLIERSTGESVKYSSTRIQNVLQALIISCWKLLWGESQICTDPKGCGMYLRLYLSLLKTPLGECKMQFHKGLECIYDCKYQLLKAPLGRVKIHFHKDMECIFSFL